MVGKGKGLEGEQFGAGCDIPQALGTGTSHQVPQASARALLLGHAVMLGLMPESFPFFTSPSPFPASEIHIPRAKTNPHRCDMP